MPILHHVRQAWQKLTAFGIAPTTPSRRQSGMKRSPKSQKLVQVALAFCQECLDGLLTFKKHPSSASQVRLTRPFNVGGLLAALTIGGVLLALIHPADALQAQVTPTNPQLGDTLSVTIAATPSSPTAPTVTVGNRTYPAFPVSGDRFRALLPTTPLDKPGALKLRVNDTNETRELALQLRGRKFPTQSIWLPPGKDQDLSDFEFNRVDAFKKIVTPEKMWGGSFLKPNNGPITTIYGVRRYYNGKFANDYYHRGVDYAGDYGSPIIAPAAGRVVLVGQEAKGFVIHGNCIGIDHGQGVESIFLHLSRIKVKDGDRVKAGQVIGALGGTGAATGPHLHWGLYVNGQAVDPGPWRNRGFE